MWSQFCLPTSPSSSTTACKRPSSPACATLLSRRNLEPTEDRNLGGKSGACRFCGLRGRRRWQHVSVRRPCRAHALGYVSRMNEQQMHPDEFKASGRVMQRADGREMSGSVSPRDSPKAWRTDSRRMARLDRCRTGQCRARSCCRKPQRAFSSRKGPHSKRSPTP